jgi:hypothetical protein
VWSRNLVNEEALSVWALSRQKQTSEMTLQWYVLLSSQQHSQISRRSHKEFNNLRNISHKLHHSPVTVSILALDHREDSRSSIYALIIMPAVNYRLYTENAQWTFQRRDFACYQLRSSHTGCYLRYNGDQTQPFVSNGTPRIEDDMTTS